MIMKANKQIGFIYKNNESIDKILKDGEVVFERGFLREKTSTTLPINFGGVGKDLKDYKVYGNTVQSKLPSGYTQVDYIESSGTQYIDTGFKPNGDTVIMSKNTFNTNSLFGVTDDNQNKSFIVSGGSGAYKSDYVRNFSAGGLRIEYDFDTDRTTPYELYVDKNKAIATINNVTYTLNYEHTTYNLSNNMYIFARNEIGTAKLFSSRKLYYFKIYDGNTLVRDFIPCYRNSDNEVGLYDLVNDVFYTNQGSGVFTYGSIAPTPSAPVEVKGVGDRTKNLFDPNSTRYQMGKALDNKISPYSGGAMFYIKATPNTEYTIKIHATGSTFVRLYLSNAPIVEGAYISYNVVSESETTLNPEVTISNTDYAYLWIQAGGTWYTEHGGSSIMLNIGSTALPYEPYGYKIPVNVRSDNLFDKDNANVYGGYLSASGVVGGNGSPSNYDNIVYIECKPNTVYVLKKMLQSDTANNRFRVGCTSEIPVQGIQTTNFFKYNDGTTETQCVYTTSSTAKYLLFYCGKNSNTTSKQQILDSIVIVEGSTVPDKYIPYYSETTNIYLGEVETIRKIRKLVLTGEEGWQFFSDILGTWQFYINNISLGGVVQSSCVSNIAPHGATATTRQRYDYGCYLVTSGNGVAFQMKGAKDTFDNVNAWKSYLQQQYANGTPVTVWYVLAESETGVISEPLCKIGDYADTVSMEQAGVQIPTVDGNNTLNIETEITPSQVYIKYKSNE